MEAKPNTDLTPELPPGGAAASLVLPGDDAPALKTFSLDSYAEDEQAHARCLPPLLQDPLRNLDELEPNAGACSPFPGDVPRSMSSMRAVHAKETEKHAKKSTQGLVQPQFRF